MPNTKTDLIEFRNLKTFFQLKTTYVLLLTSIFVSIFSFIGEFSFYQSIWQAKLLNIYLSSFIAYVVLLSLILYFIHSERKKIPNININKSRILVFCATYLITLVIYIVVFIGRFYNNELYFLAILNIVFGIGLLFNNKERLIYLLFHFILYSIGSYIVIIDSPNLHIDIGKAFSTNLITFIFGKITFDLYKEVTLNSLKLNRSTKNQLETLSYLADELNLSKGFLELDENLEELNGAIKKLLFEFSDSKKELSKTLELAEQASKAKEMFLANMSHEIRTPLNAIVGLIRELDKSNLNTQQKEYTKGAGTAAKHLLSIVNNVLDMSKIESGELVVKNEDFSLYSTLDNVVSILQSNIRKKKLNLELNIDKKINKALIGDLQLLRQILFNIIGNSIKFTNKGTITIKAELLSEKNDIQEIKISINDTGIGMTSDFLSKIFDKFSQENNKRKSEIGGTGLGMAITKELVNISNGKLNITSEEGVGTCVDIVYKFKKGNIERLYAVDLEESSTILKNKHILVVDDDAINRIVARKTLEYLGCNVVEAHNGKEAIEKLQNNKIDLVLMDIQMPVLNGVEATLAIRNKLKNNVPIIALTANAFKNDIDKYLAAGMNDYITKPFEENTMFSVLNNIFAEEINSPSYINDPQYYDISEYGSLDDDESFAKTLIAAFEVELNTLIPDLQLIIATKNYDELYSTIHKIKPSIEILKINSIFDETEYINNKIAKNWDELLDNKANKILNTLDHVHSQIKKDLTSK